MPNTWRERSREEDQALDARDTSRARNTDSSVSAQYEDHMPPDGEWRHEDES